MDSNSEDTRNDLEPVDEKFSYFEKICLEVSACERAWLFERVPGFELIGFDSDVRENVNSRLACEELCLQTESLPCRSAEYNYESNECTLSSETRRSQPGSYRATTKDLDYLENQCARDKEGLATCQYLQYENQDLGFPDIQTETQTDDQCGDRCDATTAFNCRSFTFFPATNVCLLSSDDNISAGPSQLASAEGANYYQKAPCVDLTLSCSATSMTVTLNTEEAFVGKLFSLSNPRSCQKRGSGELQTSLTFVYEPNDEEDEIVNNVDDRTSGCEAELEDEGVFTNTVVVQYHPVIQKKGDRAVKLFCFFEIAEDKVVTDSYNVIAQTVDPLDPDASVTPPPGGIPTSVVNGTAPQPEVVLRIVNEAGEDVEGTQLGEPLFIRIEVVGDTIFDIFARNLIAESGVDNEEIQLLDDRGCPTDPVFSGFEKEEESGALVGRFEAFKFSDTTVVNFQVNVQFCQDNCNPVDCGEGVLSFGRRRRSADMHSSEAVPQSWQGERLVYDDNLHQEVFVVDRPLRKRLIVQPATQIDRFTDKQANGASGIFVEGVEGDVFCASWRAAIVTAVTFVFVQACILVVCILCIHVSRRQTTDTEDNFGNTNAPLYTEGGSGSSTLPSHPSSSLGRRSQLTQRWSEATLKSLRTSLRD